MHRIGTIALTVLLALLLAAPASLGGDLKFVEKGDVFDLSDLLEGETRLFGAGDKQLSATRTGDVISLGRQAHGDVAELSITCLVGRDTCEVITSGNDDQIMLKIEKRRECHGDDCDVETLDITAIDGGLPEGAHVVVRKSVECVDRGNGEECNEFEWSGDGAAMHLGATGQGTMVFVGEDGGAPVVLDHARGQGTLLRCPRGDSTLKIDASEAGQTFLCPKHAVALEPIASRTKSAGSRVIIERKDR